MDISKQPGIKFDNIILSKLEFHRKPMVVEKPELDVSCLSKATIDEEKQRLVLELSADIKEKKAADFSLQCTIIGFFSVLEGQENLSLKQFSEINAPALLFPYLREVIANITLRSGLKPLILPPINISSFIKQSQESASKPATPASSPATLPK